MATYTLTDIEAAWEQYRKAKCLCVLKDGKWVKTLLKPGAASGNIQGTRAEVRDVQFMMGFPEYLEKHGK